MGPLTGNIAVVSPGHRMSISPTAATHVTDKNGEDGGIIKLHCRKL